ncbi:MAG: SRPBCC domain-containing protein [Longimicrobiales bacterium]
MTVDARRALTLTRTIAADPEAVFDAWTRPDLMARWSCPDPRAELEIDVDLRVGGAYRIRMAMDEGTWTALGTYREVERPRRLVYTWDWEEGDHRMDADTVVTVEFVAVDEGTRVTLTHAGFPAAEATDGHHEGWTACLDHLERMFA